MLYRTAYFSLIFKKKIIIIKFGKSNLEMIIETIFKKFLIAKLLKIDKTFEIFKVREEIILGKLKRIFRKIEKNF